METAQILRTVLVATLLISLLVAQTGCALLSGKNLQIEVWKPKKHGLERITAVEGKPDLERVEVKSFDAGDMIDYRCVHKDEFSELLKRALEGSNGL